MAKKEEKPSLICLKPFSPCHFRNPKPGFQVPKSSLIQIGSLICRNYDYLHSGLKSYTKVQFGQVALFASKAKIYLFIYTFSNAAFSNDVKKKFPLVHTLLHYFSFLAHYTLFNYAATYT